MTDDLQPLGVTVWGLERPEFGDDVVGDVVFVHLDDVEQMIVRFKNGYGASVVRRAGVSDLFEVGVLVYHGADTSARGHRTRVQVIDPMPKSEMLSAVRKIAALEKRT